MRTYEKINELKREIKTAREDYPNTSSLERLSESLDIAVRDIPFCKTTIWRDVFSYFRMKLDVVYEIRGRRTKTGAKYLEQHDN